MLVRHIAERFLLCLQRLLFVQRFGKLPEFCQIFCDFIVNENYEYMHICMHMHNAHFIVLM